LAFVFFDLIDFSLGKDGVDGFFICELLVKVGDIKDVGREFWLERRLDLFTNELLDVDVLKPGMLEDFFDSFLCSESVLGVLLEKLRNKVFAVIAHLNLVSLWVWEVYRLLPNKLIHLQVVIASSIEGREPDDHLVG
jgi:hypothetical protein